MIPAKTLGGECSHCCPEVSGDYQPCCSTNNHIYDSMKLDLKNQMGLLLVYEPSYA